MTILELITTSAFFSKWNLTQQLYVSNSDQLRDELQLLLVCCVLTGGAPIAVFPRFRARWFDVMQQCWLIVLYAWLCYAAYLELMQSSLNINELEHKFYCFESLTYLIHVPCIMLLSVRWRHKIGKVFHGIARFDLASGYIAQRYRIRRFICYQLLVVLLFTVCYITIVLCFCNFEIWKTLINLSTYVFPNILSGISLIPYYTLLNGISHRMHSLSESLKMELLSGLLTRRGGVQHLRWQHSKLLQFTKFLNQTFGVSILCVYVSSFINFNTNLFLAYKNIEAPDVEKWAWWSYIILWICMHFGKMFIILYFNNGVLQEVNYT